MNAAFSKKRSKRYCIARGCYNNDGMDKDTYAFFKLPTDSNRCIKWLKELDREDLINNAILRPHSYSVCCQHFENVSFKKFLKKDAVPTNVRARPPPPPEPPEPPGSQTCILSVDESQAAFHIPQPTDTALVQNFHPYILPKGQLNSEQDNKPNIPKATSSNTASTSEQRFFFSVETQTHPEKEVHSSQTSSDQTLQQCDLLEESRIFRNRYIRDFVRKKGLRTRNILLSHSCSDDDVCKKFCKLMEKQKKL